MATANNLARLAPVVMEAMAAMAAMAVPVDMANSPISRAMARLSNRPTLASQHIHNNHSIQASQATLRRPRRSLAMARPDSPVFPHMRQATLEGQAICLHRLPGA